MAELVTIGEDDFSDDHVVVSSPSCNVILAKMKIYCHRDVLEV